MRSARAAVMLALLLVTALAEGAFGRDDGPVVDGIDARPVADGLIAAGTDWETPFHVIESGRPGPVVLLTAGLHGDEYAGVQAAEQIRHWPLRRGKLIVIPRCNAPGLSKGTRFMPGIAKELGNANRNFPKSDGPDEARTALCTALWEFARRCRADWHIDLHEAYGYRGAGSKSCGSSIIAYPDAETEKFRERMLEAVNDSIGDPARKFVPLGPSVDGSFARASAERLDAHAMILETTTRDPSWTSKNRVYQPRSLRVRQHRIMVHRLLTDLKMIRCPSTVLLPPQKSNGPIAVAIYSGRGTGSTTSAFFRTLVERTGAVTRMVGPEDIRDGVLDRFDVALFPGGSASRQARAIGEEGRAEVRNFVRKGGGYLGVCAGAYLATFRYDWSLKILDARVVDREHWARGTGLIKMEMTPEGLEILGGREELMEIYYGQGPLLAPAKVSSLRDYTVLAWYRSEIARNGAPRGVMIDTPAIVSGHFGKGRVLAVSPHPEKLASEDGAESLILRAIPWLARRGVGRRRTRPVPPRKSARSGTARSRVRGALLPERVRVA